MEKSRLKLKDHTLRGEDKVIEVWHHDELIATVTGADGPGIRVHTKHRVDIIRGGAQMMGIDVTTIEVRIEV